MSRENSTDPPNQDEIELSLFGPGLGESIVIHVGGGRWIVVDSCKAGGSCVPLTYLRSLGVAVDKDVHFVIATHAHDDHVRGISELYAAATSARLGLPMASTKEEFRAIISFDEGLKDVRLRVFTEYLSLLNEMKERQQPGQRCWFGVSGRQTLLPAVDDLPEVELFALTPSDEDILESIEAIRRYLPLPGQPPGRLANQDPNHFAMALQITAGDRSIILGSDVLSGTRLKSTGWSAVMVDHGHRLSATEVVKVAHHGSHTGHHDETWSAINDGGVVAVLTPFQQGNQRLPTEADVSRIKTSTPHAYITSTSPKLSHSQQRLAAQVTGSARGLSLLKGETGHVRARAELGSSSPWRIDVFGHARQL